MFQQILILRLRDLAYSSEGQSVACSSPTPSYEKGELPIAVFEFSFLKADEKLFPGFFSSNASSDKD